MAKPDFLDLDKDGNKKESMKKAAKDAKKKAPAKKKTPKGFHRMPDGKLMKGETHGSRPKKNSPKKKTGEITIRGKKIKFEEGALRRALKVPDNEKLLMGDLKKANKTEVGKDFMYNGKKFKMTNLMKKRITFAITLMKMK
jgi:hypothetical protein